jgi:hypothetical protein
MDSSINIIASDSFATKEQVDSLFKSVNEERNTSCANSFVSSMKTVGLCLMFSHGTMRASDENLDLSVLENHIIVNHNEPIIDFIHDISTDLKYDFSFVNKVSRDDIKKEIISLLSLNVNWDGYGAIPLESESAFNALKFIDNLTERNIQALTDYNLNTNGTVSFEWEINDLITNIEIGNKQMMIYSSKDFVLFYSKDNVHTSSENIEDFNNYLTDFLG